MDPPRAPKARQAESKSANKGGSKIDSMDLIRFYEVNLASSSVVSVVVRPLLLPLLSNIQGGSYPSSYVAMCDAISEQPLKVLRITTTTRRQTNRDETKRGPPWMWLDIISKAHHLASSHTYFSTTTVHVFSAIHTTHTTIRTPLPTQSTHTYAPNTNITRTTPSDRT